MTGNTNRVVSKLRCQPAEHRKQFIDPGQGQRAGERQPEEIDARNAGQEEKHKELLDLFLISFFL